MKIAPRWKLKNYSELKSDWPRCFKVVAALQNNKKKSAAWAGTFVIVVMCLFPPFISNSYSDEGSFFRGYAYLFSAGRIFVRSYNVYIPAHIDFVRLIIQCAIVGLITGVLLYTLNDKKAEGSGK